VKVVQRLPVRIRLEPHAGQPSSRTGVTATVSIDTGRGRSIADVVTGFLDLFRGKAEAAGAR
jgi:membrane fusion protein (multidrug efflux system)